jgi:hypothetical protein
MKLFKKIYKHIRNQVEETIIRHEEENAIKYAQRKIKEILSEKYKIKNPIVYILKTCFEFNDESEYAINLETYRYFEGNHYLQEGAKIKVIGYMELSLNCEKITEQLYKRFKNHKEVKNR